ncbi:hypothetical protein lerEdw1_000553 [Lerista edwardsae]|nr:hypothetical protein lerEdw1_000553 [Lerista edwardsae]
MPGKCGIPMPIENAEIELTGSARLRYSCVKDYKRKAGTSNLIVCRQDDVTKQYRWTKANLNCTRDPSKPAPPGTTKGSRQKTVPLARVIETETSTPTRKSATPQTSVNAAMVTMRPPGNPTTNSAPASSTTGTILPTAAGPWPDASVVTASTTAVVGWLSPGTVAKNTTLQERTTTQDSRARTSSQPSLKSPTARSRWTAGPWRATAGNATQPPSGDGLDRQTGSPSVRIVLPCVAGVLIIILSVLTWYFSERLK